MVGSRLPAAADGDQQLHGQGVAELARLFIGVPVKCDLFLRSRQGDALSVKPMQRCGQVVLVRAEQALQRLPVLFPAQLQRLLYASRPLTQSVPVFGSAKKRSLEEQKKLPGQPSQHRIAQRHIFLFIILPQRIGLLGMLLIEPLDLVKGLRRRMFQPQPPDAPKQ